jgi:predicted DNA-binding protein
MTLSILLPPDAEARLQERARASGQDVAEYVRQLISRELEAPLSLLDAAEPFARAVDAAGVSDEEFTDILVKARDEARRERRRI